ncbi:MAG: hypothetical protein QM726_16600 [Chitinophagaceae bacterium]
MKKYCIAVAIATSGLLLCIVAIAQTGTITAKFTDKQGKVTNINISTKLFDANDGYARWFKHPSGRNRFSYSPRLGYGNGVNTFQIAEVDLYFHKGDQDLDLYKYGYHESANYFAFNIKDASGIWAIGSPVYDYRDKDNNKPLHLHINSFTDTEIDLDFSGNATYYTGANVDIVAMGHITGKLHLYRKPGVYGKTDAMPGCSNCDPNIYLWEYDKPEQTIRSASACEAEFMKKRFNVKKQALQAVLSLDYGGNGTMKPGDVNVTPVIIVSNKSLANDKLDFVLCNEKDTSSFMVGVNSEKTFFEDEQSYSYGINIVGSPANDMPSQDAMKASSEKMKQIMIAYQNKKITAEEMQKQMLALQDSPQMKKENADFKKAESLNSLTIEITVNPQGLNGYMTGGVNNKSSTVIQHKIAQAVAEVFSPATQNSDGSWTKDQLTVFIGKFSTPTIGWAQDTEKGITAKVNYPANGNKLSAYGLVVKFKGDKRLIDRALPLINWNALKNFIAP